MPKRNQDLSTLISIFDHVIKTTDLYKRGSAQTSSNGLKVTGLSAFRPHLSNKKRYEILFFFLFNDCNSNNLSCIFSAFQSETIDVFSSLGASAWVRMLQLWNPETQANHFQLVRIHGFKETLFAINRLN